jgi:hypothetical protein
VLIQKLTVTDGFQFGLDRRARRIQGL